MSDTETLKNLSGKIQQARSEIAKMVIGQEDVVDLTMTTLMAGGHVLLIGAPGLAKTLLVTTVAQVMGLASNRIQCTPDLMPSDILGSEVLEEDNGKRAFRFIAGPIFTQFLMADEINRASPRTQSALLQAMQEGYVSVAGQHHQLPKPFHVLATQNPIEQEGTYPLPEAQLDRFLMHIEIDYPDAQTELEILRLTRREDLHQGQAKPMALSQATIMQARQDILGLHVQPQIEEYIVQLVMATRHPDKYQKQLKNYIAMGVSPRATIALERCARAHAYLQGRDFVAPDNVQTVFHNVMRHRLPLTYEAQANGVSVNGVLDNILANVAVP